MLAGLDARGAFGRKIWGLLCLELWQQMFHDREAHFKATADDERTRSMKVLITGGGGFIGSHLADRLLD